MIRCLMCLLLFLVLASGCRQSVTGTAQREPLFGRLGQNGAFNQSRIASNSFFNRRGQSPRQIQTNSPEEFQEYSQLSREINSLNQQLGSFDSDNQQLVTEIASLKQKLQVASDYNNQIKQQLADSSAQLQQIQVEKQNMEQRLAQSLQETQNRNQFASASGGLPTQLIGGATVRANNSLLQNLSRIQIPGGQARMDGDVIRVEFPSDILFQPGTYQIRNDQSTTVRNIVNTIRNYFPEQIIGIEAHWDGTQLNPPTTTHHQLTATQSLAVFNQLVQYGLPADQLFTMAMGSNRPRHPQAPQGNVSPNRRIEIVIYPERYNGN